MLTDQEIAGLIRMPKAITSRTPATGYSDSGGHSRCTLELDSVIDPPRRFTVFLRKHQRFIENFSIGLRYRTGDSALGLLTLVRYNGAHGEYSLSPDEHFARPHIHYVTAQELAEGFIQPQERRRETTDLFQTYEEALDTFLQDISVTNSATHFPELNQPRLFSDN